DVPRARVDARPLLPPRAPVHHAYDHAGLDLDAHDGRPYAPFSEGTGHLRSIAALAVRAIPAHLDWLHRNGLSLLDLSVNCDVFRGLAYRYGGGDTDFQILRGFR